MSSPQKIYLIRHGETAWSLSGRHTSRTDLPLTEKGEAEARELGKHLPAGAFGPVLTSPRQRARRTCELADPRAHAEVTPELQEWDYGDYEGKTSAEIERLAPGWNLFRDGCPGGESPDQIGRRADSLLRRLRSMEGGVALFSHGHILRVLAARWLGLPADAARFLLLGTASLSILGFEHDRIDSPVIALWNAGARDLFGGAPPP